MSRLGQRRVGIKWGGGRVGMVFRFRVCFYLSVQWRGWADIFPYLAIMIMIIIIMMMIIIVICRD